MIKPISFSLPVSFRGVENNNFKGATNALSADNNSVPYTCDVRGDYSAAVKGVSNLQEQFTVQPGFNRIA